MDNISTGVILQYVLRSVLPATIAVVVGFLLIAFIERQTDRLMARKDFPAYTGSNVKLLIRWTLGLVIFLAFVSILGVPITSLWAVVSAVLAMTAVGLFAGWSLISSSLALLIILIRMADFYLAG